MTQQNHRGGPSAPGRPTASPASSAPGTRTRVRWWVALAVAVPLILLGVVAITGLDRPDAGMTSSADLDGGSASSETAGSDRPEVGDQVPLFTVPTLSGGAFQMPNGTPTILTFIWFVPVSLGLVPVAVVLLLWRRRTRRASGTGPATGRPAEAEPDACCSTGQVGNASGTVPPDAPERRQPTDPDVLSPTPDVLRPYARGRDEPDGRSTA